MATQESCFKESGKKKIYKDFNCKINEKSSNGRIKYAIATFEMDVQFLEKESTLKEIVRISTFF